MPDVRTLLETLPVRARITEDGLAIQNRKGETICTTESRDWAMILEVLLNRYFGARLDELVTTCPICGVAQETRLLEDADGILTLELCCLVGAATKNGCPGTNFIPLLRRSASERRSRSDDLP